MFQIDYIIGEFKKANCDKNENEQYELEK